MKKNSKGIVEISKQNVKNIDFSKPSMNMLVEMEFELPDISIGGFDTQKEFGKFLDKLVDKFESLLGNQEIAFGKSNN